jgi:hypothetical protein
VHKPDIRTPRLAPGQERHPAPQRILPVHPDLLGFLLRLRKLEPAPSVLIRDLPRDFRCLLDGAIGRALELEVERVLLRVLALRRAVQVRCAHEGVVTQLDALHAGADGVHDRSARGDGGPDVRERDDGDGRRKQRREADGQLGDDTQSAFRADEELGGVEAGGGFAGSLAGLDHFAGGKDDRLREKVRGRRAELRERVLTALRNHSPLAVP